MVSATNYQAFKGYRPYSNWYRLMVGWDDYWTTSTVFRVMILVKLRCRYQSTEHCKSKDGGARSRPTWARLTHTRPVDGGNAHSIHSGVYPTLWVQPPWTYFYSPCSTIIGVTILSNPSRAAASTSHTYGFPSSIWHKWQENAVSNRIGWRFFMECW